MMNLFSLSRLSTSLSLPPPLKSNIFPQQPSSRYCTPPDPPKPKVVRRNQILQTERFGVYLKEKERKKLVHHALKSSRNALFQMKEAVTDPKRSSNFVAFLLREAIANKRDSLDMYNLALSYFCKNKKLSSFYRVLDLLERSGSFEPNDVTFGILFKELTENPSKKRLEETIKKMEALQIPLNEILVNSIIQAYCALNDTENADLWYQKIFTMPLPITPFSFSAYLKVLILKGAPIEEWEALFRKYPNEYQVQHDALSYVSLIVALAERKEYEKALSYFREGVELLPDQSHYLYPHGITLFKEYGDMRECWLVFEKGCQTMRPTLIQNVLKVIKHRRELDYLPLLLSIVQQNPKIQDHGVLRHFTDAYLYGGELKKGLKFLDSWLLAAPMLNVRVAKIIASIDPTSIPPTLRHKADVLKSIVSKLSADETEKLVPDESLILVDYIQHLYEAVELPFPYHIKQIMEKQRKFQAEDEGKYQQFRTHSKYKREFDF